MKRDGKYILIILAVWFLVMLVFPLPRPKNNAIPETGKGGKKKNTAIYCPDLKAWYAGFNETYFNDTLPKDTVIGYGDAGENNIGITLKTNGLFHIILSPEFNTAPRIAHETLLHEICHVAHWEDEFDVHGPKWQKCMLSLAERGAFEEIW